MFKVLHHDQGNNHGYVLGNDLGNDLGCDTVNNHVAPC